MNCIKSPLTKYEGIIYYVVSHITNVALIYIFITCKACGRNLWSKRYLAQKEPHLSISRHSGALKACKTHLISEK